MLQNNQHCCHFQGDFDKRRSQSDKYYIESPQQPAVTKSVKSYWACLFDISGIWCVAKKMWTIWGEVNLIWVVLLLFQHPGWGRGRLGQNMYLGIWPLSFTNSFIERLKWRGNISDRGGDKKRWFCNKNQIVRICLKSWQREGQRRPLLKRMSDWHQWMDKVTNALTGKRQVR